LYELIKTVTPTSQQKLVCQLLTPLLARRRPQRVLILKHTHSSDLSLELVAPALVVRISSDPFCSDGVPRCRLTALPFAEAAFDVIVLHHLLSDGSEVIMTEVLRVLAADGDLVISGLNSSGLRNRLGNRQKQLPALKLDRICGLMKSKSFDVEQCLLMGLCGLSRPAPKATWHGLGLPFADRVVLQGHRHASINNGGILRFKRPQVTGVRPTALDGVSRRAEAS